MAEGTVKFYNASKGFGFISSDEEGKDIFFHVSALERSGISGLSEGQRVTFDIEMDRTGRGNAINITIGGGDSDDPGPSGR